MSASSEPLLGFVDDEVVVVIPRQEHEPPALQLLA